MSDFKIPNTPASINKEKIENEKRLNEIEYKLREEYSEPDAFILEHEAIEIKKYNEILNLKKQYILDKRNGWILKLIWSIIAPVIVALLTSILIKN